MRKLYFLTTDALWWPCLLQFLAQETIEGVSLGWAEIPRFSMTSDSHRGPHVIYVYFFSAKTWPVQTLDHYGKSTKKCCVCPFPWMRVVWCSAQLNCTRLAPPCSKIGFEREESDGTDQTQADDGWLQNTAMDSQENSKLGVGGAGHSHGTRTRTGRQPCFCNTLTLQTSTEAARSSIRQWRQWHFFFI